jgi:dihydrofolate reductase
MRLVLRQVRKSSIGEQNMLVSLIVAMDNNRGIGFNNRLPWRLPDDLKRFKTLTLSHHLIMGRKTYESIGRTLPGRTSIVISRNPDFSAPDCAVVQSLEHALELAETNGEDEAFVIGGSQIFEKALSRADRIYLTRVHVSLPADVFFPAIDPGQWQERLTEFHPPDDKHPFGFTFQILKRRES